VTPLKNDFEEWLRNRKWSNCFPWLFPLNVFITISFFPHVYPLHALIYGLKFILEQKNEICFKNVFLIVMALAKITFLNFGNS